MYSFRILTAPSSMSLKTTRHLESTLTCLCRPLGLNVGHQCYFTSAVPPLPRSHTSLFADTPKNKRSIVTNPLQYKLDPVHKLKEYPFSSSVTTFRFDDPSTNETGVEITEQWIFLMDHLKRIVDGLRYGNFEGDGPEFDDVQCAWNKYTAAKLHCRPYSYTSDDILTLLRPAAESELPLHFSEDANKNRQKISTDGLKSSEEINKNRRQTHQAFLNSIEQESLRAVCVLTSENLDGNSGFCDSARSIRDYTVAVADISSLAVRVRNLEYMESRIQFYTGDNYSFECSSGGVEKKGSNLPNDIEQRGRPNSDQLAAIQNYMAENMPKLFVASHDYSIYTSDIVFENSWYHGQTYTTVGQLMYGLEIAKLRLFVHVKLANVKMQLLKSTTHVDDGSVRVRWRVTGIPQTKALFMFWKFLPPWNSKTSTIEDHEWLDGFSTFFVDGNGKIYKHKMDRVIPDEGQDSKVKANIVEKLGLKVGAPAAT